MEGSEASSALTTSFIPSFLAIILSGLSALRALNAFNACSYYTSILAIINMRSNNAADTTNESSIFQYDFIYGLIGPMLL